MSQSIKDARAKLENLRPNDFYFRILQGFEGICPDISEFLTIKDGGAGSIKHCVIAHGRTVSLIISFF